MTTGSKIQSVTHDGLSYKKGSGPNDKWEFDDYVYRGSTINISWSGGDSGPIVNDKSKPKRKYVVHTTVGKNGKKYKFRVYEPSPQRNAVKKAQRSPNAFTKSFLVRRIGDCPEYTEGPPSNRTSHRGRPFVDSGAYVSFSNLPDASWGSNEDIALLSKLQEEIKGSDFNFAVFLGEGHQTLALIADAAKRVADSFLSLKRGNVSGAIKALAPNSRISSRSVKSKPTLSQQWLELQYGWKPLLDDMKSGAEILSAQLSVPKKQKYRASKTVKIVGPKAISLCIAGQPNVSNLSDAGSIYRKSIIATIVEPTPIQLSGLLDPELVVWEAVPFSFIADWALPIGEYLSNRAFYGRLNGTYVTSTLRKRWYWGPVAFGASFAGAGEESGSFVRTISNSLSVPSPSVKPLDKILSWQHCANALALFDVTFRRG